MPGTGIHPKVTAAGLAGVVYAIVVVAAEQFGVTADPRVAAVIGPVVAVVAGYLKAAPAPPAFADASDPIGPDGDDSIHAAA